VITEEDLRFGQRVQRYRLEAKNAQGDWSMIAEGQTLGRMKIDRLPSPVEARSIRLRILDSAPMPGIRRLAAGEESRGGRSE
jgi:alpha-L-fucosidase